MILRYLDLPRFADKIFSDLKQVIEEKNARTKFIGKSHLANDFTNANIDCV
jgi:hypothetical protein